ncbi:LCP family protein [Nonomuraea sp. NPDC048916]|uniref:LCP family protein n=1 Tax=Nonomuraea sp. NPDC048916 TaxID=3154232 RepID=UPI0033E54CF4
MDDLRMLRDLGRELESRPPATMVRQRERMLRGGSRRRLTRRWTGRWAGWWAAGLVAVTTAAVVAVPSVLVSVRHTAAPPAGARVADVSGARNVLVIGSDTLEGPGNAAYGPQAARRNAGKRADTIVLVHLSAGRKKATAVSIPRDSLVPIPRCSSAPATTAMINSAYDKGGAACLGATLEQLTGLTIDHSVEVDFAGFKGMVDALGGVEVTLPTAVNDKASKLDLPAGRSLVNGEQALGFVRLRRYGDGSDIQRIKRQQQLMLAMLEKVRSQVVEPAKLNAFLGEVGRSVKTDLDMESMYELARSLSKAEVSFLTVPWLPHPDDPHRIQWKQPEADRLFERLKSSH